MNTDLAEALLGKTMDWSEEILSKERYLIQLFADIKYDGYQQYSQGMKYTESLALWLNNFDVSDRNMIYNFIKNNLIFISELQMRNLVELTFPLYISPILINNAKNISNENNIVGINDRKNIFNCLQNQSLFLGLSDGAHIDIFRRSNQNLSNEQINIYYDFSMERVKEIKEELSAKISKLPTTPISNNWVKCIFLLDDFAGSGISFVRKEGKLWKGKIIKFLTQIREYGLPYEDINIYIILYISTDEAITYINNQLCTYKRENNLNIDLKLLAIQTIQKTLISDDILTILEKYYRQFNMNNIEDKHFKKGDYSQPFLGFNKCSLPLVIYHNTPNNSFPIIWFENTSIFKGLFPRVRRHKEDNL